MTDEGLKKKKKTLRNILHMQEISGSQPEAELILITAVDFAFAKMSCNNKQELIWIQRTART